MHRSSDFDNSERVDVFHVVSKWTGKVKNTEAHKCDDLCWFEIDNLPKNIIEYIAIAIKHINDGVFYSEFGW